MSAQFSRTLRSLQAESSGQFMWALLLVLVLLGLWGGWFFLGSVRLYVVSERARLESRVPSLPLQAAVGGQVARTHVGLGQQVRMGDLLVELDASLEQRQLEQEDARLKAFAAQLAALRAELAAEKVAGGEEHTAARAGLERARALLQMSESEERLASHEADRLERLASQGHVSAAEALQASLELARRRAAVRAASAEVQRLEAEGGARASQGHVRIEQRRLEVARVEAELAESRARRETIERAIAERQLRAPMDGTVGELVPLRPGAVVKLGEYLGTIVPLEGQLTVVAYFRPERALGRIREGQPAQVRLSGFPWMQYGILGARVRKVASETQTGAARVELVLERVPKIPVQHGLPGTVEIEVEQSSPARLVLRAAGRLLDPEPPPPAPADIFMGMTP